MFKSKKLLVSVCVPVFETEKYLERCLNSVAEQEFDGLEIIVTDDCSPENTSEGIVKQFRKRTKLPVTFIRHKKNLGLVEARRSAVLEAKGEYILILDSDDTLAANGINSLYKAAKENTADIVQGKANAEFSQTVLQEIENSRSEAYRLRTLQRINKVCEKNLTGGEILDGYLVEKNHQGFLWGKLFRRELYLEALSHIPPVFCTMAEDVIQYFWLALLAEKYVGIQEIVYNYSINTGISSRTVIKSLERWEKVCSAASVFTAIFSELETAGNISLTQKQTAALRQKCRAYVKNNLEQLKLAVVPELQNEARKMLYEYWGKELVEKIEGEREINDKD